MVKSEKSNNRSGPLAGDSVTPDRAGNSASNRPSRFVVRPGVVFLDWAPRGPIPTIGDLRRSIEAAEAQESESAQVRLTRCEIP